MWDVAQVPYHTSPDKYARRSCVVQIPRGKLRLDRSDHVNQDTSAPIDLDHRMVIYLIWSVRCVGVFFTTYQVPVSRTVQGKYFFCEIFPVLRKIDKHFRVKYVLFNDFFPVLRKICWMWLSWAALNEKRVYVVCLVCLLSIWSSV